MANGQLARVTMRKGRGNTQGEGMWEGGHGKSDQLKWVKKGFASGSFHLEVKFSEAGKLRDCAHSPIHLPEQVFTQATCAHCPFVHQVCGWVCVTPWETPASMIWDSAQLCRKFVTHEKVNGNKNSLYFLRILNLRVLGQKAWRLVVNWILYWEWQTQDDEEPLAGSDMYLGLQNNGMVSHFSLISPLFLPCK